MGMKQQAHWNCDRCTCFIFADFGVVPKGWMAVYMVEVSVDVDTMNGSLDTRLPRKDDIRILCENCTCYLRKELSLPEIEDPDKPLVDPDQVVQDAQTRGTEDVRVETKESGAQIEPDHELTVELSETEVLRSVVGGDDNEAKDG